MFVKKNSCLYWVYWEVYQRNKPALCDSLEGWKGDGSGRGVQEGGDICIPMADACWCMAKTITIL